MGSPSLSNLVNVTVVYGDARVAEEDAEGSNNAGLFVGSVHLVNAQG
jgi:hypothetical protein